MPTAWRIVPEHRAETAFDGEGARLFGGRWNSRGVRMVYCSDSRALSVLEILVHLTPQTMNRRLRLIGVEISPDLIEDVPESKLPENWRSTIVPAENEKLGNQWIRGGRSAVLRICSTIVPEEHNYLLNPAHRALAHLQITHNTCFSLDPRLKENNVVR